MIGSPRDMTSTSLLSDLDVLRRGGGCSVVRGIFGVRRRYLTSNTGLRVPFARLTIALIVPSKPVGTEINPPVWPNVLVSGVVAAAG